MYIYIYILIGFFFHFPFLILNPNISHMYLIWHARELRVNSVIYFSIFFIILYFYSKAFQDSQYVIPDESPHSYQPLALRKVYATHLLHGRLCIYYTGDCVSIIGRLCIYYRATVYLLYGRLCIYFRATVYLL